MNYPSVVGTPFGIANSAVGAEGGPEKGGGGGGGGGGCNFQLWGSISPVLDAFQPHSSTLIIVQRHLDHVHLVVGALIMYQGVLSRGEFVSRIRSLC